MKWMDLHIEACTQRLVNLWKAQAAKVQGNYTELMELEQQLYNWAIDGGYTHIKRKYFSKIIHSLFSCVHHHVWRLCCGECAYGQDDG